MEQHVVKAPVEGWVRGCKIEVGQQVSDNTILCHIEVGILEMN
jgi:biotin carboxyl carrier protein